MEKTLVILKPDAVSRKLVGRIIQIFEDANLTLVGLKLLTPSVEMVDRHYPTDRDWVAGVGQRTIDGFKEIGRDPLTEVGSEDAYEVGTQVRGWLMDFMSSAPVVAMAWEGNLAAKNVRRLVGHTIPALADAGTIRGRFEIDSAELGTLEKRPVLNLIHASGDAEEGKREVALWFPELA